MQELEKLIYSMCGQCYSGGFLFNRTAKIKEFNACGLHMSSENSFDMSPYEHLFVAIYCLPLGATCSKRGPLEGASAILRH